MLTNRFAIRGELQQGGMDNRTLLIILIIVLLIGGAGWYGHGLWW
jgi:hypothetical protein